MGRKLMFCYFMMLSSLGNLALGEKLDFNSEIQQISVEQFEEHLKTLEINKVTEAAFDFEQKYRKPSMGGKLTDLTIRIKAK